MRKEWLNGGKPQIILDNLLAEGKNQANDSSNAKRSCHKDDRATGNIRSRMKVQGFANFERCFSNDLIPFIEKEISSFKR